MGILPRIFARDRGDAELTHLVPGLTWEGLADGRVHRLKRRKHYRGSTHILQKQAAIAAEAMSMGFRGVRDELGRYEYLWAQFGDYEIALGEPCPCGSVELEQVHAWFAWCRRCGASIVLNGRVPELLSEDELDVARSRQAAKVERRGSGKQGVPPLPSSDGDATAPRAKAPPDGDAKASRAKAAPDGDAKAPDGDAKAPDGDGKASDGDAKAPPDGDAKAPPGSGTAPERGSSRAAGDTAAPARRAVVEAAAETARRAAAEAAAERARRTAEKEQRASEKEQRTSDKEQRTSEKERRTVQRRLDAFRDVELQFLQRDERTERWRGTGYFNENAVLIIVDYFLDEDGNRKPIPGSDDEYLHRVSALHLRPFTEFLDLDRLRPGSDMDLDVPTDAER